MKYLPWLAGGALAGYLHRKGPRGLRDGEGIPPAQLDLSTITLGPWTAVPVPEQKEDRWGGTTRLWNVVGPQKGFSLWRYWPKSWGVNLGGDYRLFLKKGRSYVGYMLLDEVRHQGESAWVVTQSSLEKGYRGVGLGSLMYLASRNLLEAYQGGPVKFIPTEDYLGGTSGGTSPMAQKVWKRLRGEGRLNRRRGRSLPETGYTLSVVSIYRAVPRGVTDIKPMDYVTRTKKWAEGHADHVAAVEEEESIVLKAMVKSADVYEASNPGEYFYDGPAVRGRVIYRSQP